MIGANGALVLVAGNGGYDSKGDGGPATAAEIGYPGSLAVDRDGNLYLGDSYNFRIRKVSTKFGTLASAPVIRIGDVTAGLAFSGINGGPGLYQFNVVVPSNVPDGDLPVTVSYAGTSTPVATITVKK